MGLQPYTQNSIVDYDELMEELDLIRRQGFAEDNEEIIMGLYCLAAPVRNHMGRAEAAVSLSVPLYRVTEEKKSFLKEEVVRVADAISRQLGYKGQTRKPGSARTKS
jgi:DNA-binding IclR family transcriptional regulator